MKSLEQILIQYPTTLYYTHLSLIEKLSNELYENGFVGLNTFQVDTSLEPIEAYDKFVKEFTTDLDKRFYRLMRCQITNPRDDHLVTIGDRVKSVKNQKGEVLYFNILVLLNAFGDAISTVTPKVNPQGNKIYGVAITDINSTFKIINPDSKTTDDIIENFGNNRINERLNYFGTSEPNTSKFNVVGFKEFLNRQEEFEQIRNEVISKNELKNKIYRQSMLAILNKLAGGFGFGKFEIQEGYKSEYFRNFDPSEQHEQNFIRVAIADDNNWEEAPNTDLHITFRGFIELTVTIVDWLDNKEKVKTVFKNVAKSRDIILETKKLTKQ